VRKEVNQCNKEWFNEESAQAILEKNNDRKRMLQRDKNKLRRVSRIKKGSE
jgi:hypothetical protein